MSAPRLRSPVPLEFWFEFGSNYSYLSVMRIEALAQRHGVAIAWKPFLLGPVFQSLGWQTSPFVAQREKGAYVWRDMARLCERYALPWCRPSTFPRRALLPMRVALLAADEPWMGKYCRRMMLLNFAEDRDIDNPAAVAEVLEGIGLPAAPWLEAAQSAGNKERLRQQTELARQRGIFGAPTFFAGDEMFWGNDRMEDALVWAARTRVWDEARERAT
jgi:2-hydroxychromene-2-carboxylate isomerase